jgi:2-keto-4-pentenoate hydratase/2-oxohepta-3-ene-1,7-dioic acid hydratase in catechol pathway
MRLVSYRLPGDEADDAARVGVVVPGTPGSDAAAGGEEGVVPLTALTGAEAGEPARVGPFTALPGAEAGEPARVVALADLAGPVAGSAALDPATAALDMRRLLRADLGLRRTRAAFVAAVAAGVATHPLAGLRLAAPIADPGKIVCVGQNYAAHVREQGLPLPERPMLFAKFANAVVADGEPVVRHAETRALDLEAELAVVVGRRMHRVTAEDALAHVAGYTAANDISARDLQGSKPALEPGRRGDGQWLRAKGSDTFCPLGPTLVTPEDLPDPGRLRLRSWRVAASGADAGKAVPMQDAGTDDMVFDVPRLLAFVSAVITLEPGDIVLTGTPSGVGVFREPPVFLQPGDVVVVEVGGVGRLTNPIVDADGSVPAGSPAARVLAGDRPSVA